MPDSLEGVLQNSAPEDALAQQGLYWRRGRVSEAAALVDGENYFRAFHRSAQRARRYILIAGWQFNLETRLLRGQEARESALPVTFWSFLRALCERREELRVYVLSWDYSLIYVLEREWLQSVRARMRQHPRMKLAFRTHPDTIGSHHQKLVVIDDELAFVGGLDFCESRWDTRRHRAHESQRRSAPGLPSKPYHDIAAAVTGPVVVDLTELFVDAWRSASEESLVLPRLPGSPPRHDLASLLDTELHSLPRKGMVLCRTLPRSGAVPAVTEIQKTYEHLIRGAERLIYIETQYFTSSAIGTALLERMADATRPQLALIIVMPNEADSPKEHFVLGGRQEHILQRLRSAAARYGHVLRIVSVVAEDAEGHRVRTFIHSKLMIVDDRAVTFGSANLTNRSMSFDSELNLAWIIDAPRGPLAEIRALRASLLAEHAGRELDLFLDPASALSELDRALDDPGCKLQRRPVHDAPEDDSLWVAVFDPSTELWVRHRSDLRAYAQGAENESLAQRLFWTARLAFRLAAARTASRLRRRRGEDRGEVLGDSAPQPMSGESTHLIGLKFVLGLIVLYGLVAIAGKAFAEPLRQLGRAFVDVLGLPGFALGTFLADGLHFPVPPQFYMLMTVALEQSALWSLLSITVGSLIGGVFGFLAALRFSRVRWIERRFARLRGLPITRHMERHPYRWVVIASLTPVAFSWLCYLAGFYRFPRAAFLLLCLLRVPKILLYFAIVRAGWVHVLS